MILRHTVSLRLGATPTSSTFRSATELKWELLARRSYGSTLDLRNISSSIDGASVLPAPSMIDKDVTDSASHDHPRQIQHDQNISIANDKVENWASPAYAHHPFRPDFTLFEPIKTLELAQTQSHLQPGPSSDINATDTLCDRLLYLLETDLVAAEELRSHLLQTRINLPSRQRIIQHCFDFLLCDNDVHRYLRWLDIIPDCTLRMMMMSKGKYDSFFDTHLNHLMFLCPHSLDTFRILFEKVMVKGCLTKSFIRTTINHLVRTQSPRSVLQFYHETLLKMGNRRASPGVTHYHELCGTLHDRTISQLANQRYLSEALNLFDECPESKSTPSRPLNNMLSPSTHRVLADQLLRCVAEERTTDPSFLGQQLERVLLSWESTNPISLNSWLSSAPNVPKLPHGSIMKHNTLRTRHDYEPSALSTRANFVPELTDTTRRLVLYLKTILSHQSHMKFVKSSHIANNIDKLMSIGTSNRRFEEASKQLGYCDIQDTEEQYLKALVFDRAKLQDFLLKTHGTSEHLDFEEQLLSPIFLNFNGDVILIWAHSWMIYYQRKKQYKRVIDLFLRYFIPVGVDPAILDAHRSVVSSSSTMASLSPDCAIQRLIPPIHPTTGVLTVLYDSILRSCPAKSVSSVLRSFIESIPLPSNSSFDAGTPLLVNNHVISASKSNSVVSDRLQPNSASFQPFLRAFLRIGDVDSALNLMIEMQLRLHSHPGSNSSDEGTWVDLLECCARQSAGSINRWTKKGDWGQARSRRKLGWSGEMKERLVYSVIERFLRSESQNHRPLIPPDSHTFQQNKYVDPLDLIPKLYAQHRPKIDFYLDQVDWSHLAHLQTSVSPTLRLLRRVKAGFESCGNRRGVRVIGRLVDWRMGNDITDRPDR